MFFMSSAENCFASPETVNRLRDIFYASEMQYLQMTSLWTLDYCRKNGRVESIM